MAKRWARMAMVFGLVALTSPAALQGETHTTSGTTDKVPICFGEKLIHIPKIRNLRVTLTDNTKLSFGSLNTIRHDPRYDATEKAPLDALSVDLRWSGFGEDKVALMETILGRHSDYEVTGLRVWQHVLPDFETWWRNHPVYKVRPSGIVEFTPLQAQLFKRPIKVWCNRKGLPYYSSDPESRICYVKGLTPDNQAVRFSIATGQDLYRHWPTAESDWEDLSMKSWAAPLAEVEQAILTLLKPDERGTVCN